MYSRIFGFRKNKIFANYKYKQIFKEGKNIIVGNAIFSKYKIIDKGVINFPNSTNNAVYADIIKDKDTLASLQYALTIHKN